MLDVLQEYKHRNKEDVLYECVKERLHTSLNTYSTELEETSKYLMNRKEESVVRRLR